MDVGVRQTGCAARVTHLLGQSPGLPKGVTSWALSCEGQRLPVPGAV